MIELIFSKNKLIAVTFFALCICAVSSYLGGTYYYAVLFLLSCIFVISRKNKIVYSNCAWVLIIAILSTVINLPVTPPVFRPLSRMFTLVIVMLVCAPICNNRIIYEFRHKLFGGMAVGLTFVGVVSALLATMNWGYWGDSPWLVGLSDYPNSLGYSLAISIMFLLSCLLKSRWYIKVILILMIALCIWAVPLTGTRTAFYSIPICFLVYIFLISRNVKKMLRIFVVFFALCLIFFLIVDLDMALINRKNEMQSFRHNSRTELFEKRILEFLEHPILGIGTFVVDTRWSPVNKNGNTEVGNTFLMFLSMNGAVGFVNFVVMYLTLLIPFVKYILKKRKLGLITNFEMFLFSVVVYNFISMMQMGILLNPGLYITAFNWLSISLMYKPCSFLRKSNANVIV